MAVTHPDRTSAEHRAVRWAGTARQPLIWPHSFAAKSLPENAIATEVRIAMTTPESRQAALIDYHTLRSVPQHLEK